MELIEIVKKLDRLNVSERRIIDDDYCEIVCPAEDIEALNNIFTDFLGPAEKPAGVEPSEDIKHATNDYGIIRVNQTLFLKNFGDYKVIAMFLPWDAGDYITVKIARVAENTPLA